MITGFDHAAVCSGDVCLLTSWPLARLVARLEAEDAAIPEGPVTKSGAGRPIRSVYINDTGGNLIEVGTYDMEDPARES